MTTHVEKGAEERPAIERLLTAMEVAEQLSVPESWLYGAARRGVFPAVKVGRYVRFRQEDVTEWIRSGGQVV
ncbi:helix-turn-helix domain-containing protein [Nocardioides renjunii]|uniref:helix-turn-helix domain-containing protein n=1 Tax=Nocardioides renjunii TaxID=3095075 RepID=UPI0034DB3542